MNKFKHDLLIIRFGKIEKSLQIKMFVEDIEITSVKLLSKWTILNEEEDIINNNSGIK